MNTKLQYFLTQLKHSQSSSRFQCPSCKCAKSVVVSRKYLITTLRRCNVCHLLFRAPTTNEEENARFYQSTYKQGFTTDLPNEQELNRLLTTGFIGSEKDYSVYLSVLKAFGCRPGDKLFDFGCSWGYGSWQFAKSGFQVLSYEISRPRCEFAKNKLGVKSYDSLEKIDQGDFDVFFSAHVLEHVPSVSAVFEYARKKLKKGGLFVAFTPNGSEDFRKAAPVHWKKLWGTVHPNFLDDLFYMKNLPDVLLASNPYDLADIKMRWGNNGKSPALNGVELLAVCKISK